MKEMNPPLPEKKKAVHLTNNQVGQIERIARSVLGMLIGLTLTMLFSLVILGVLFLAARRVDEQSIDLLKTLLTMMASTLAGVTGYVYGRNSAQK